MSHEGMGDSFLWGRREANPFHFKEFSLQVSNRPRKAFALDEGGCEPTNSGTKATAILA